VVFTDTSTGDQTLRGILPTVNGYSLQTILRDSEAENTSNLDLAFLSLYTPENTSLESVWVSLMAASSKSSLPSWNDTLINFPIRQGIQPEVEPIEVKAIQLSTGSRKTYGYIFFSYLKTNQKESVLYWYDSVIFSVNSTLEHKYVQLSLITYPDNNHPQAYVENQMLTLAEAVSSYWQGVSIWSGVMVIETQYGVSVAVGLILLLLIVTLFLYYSSKVRQTKENRLTYSKLSQRNKEFLDAVRRLERRSYLTFERIAAYFQNEIGEEIRTNELIEKLSEMEKIGLLKSSIMNKEDNPKKTWKTLFN
jgi:hypothetical protein